MSPFFLSKLKSKSRKIENKINKLIVIKKELEDKMSSLENIDNFELLEELSNNYNKIKEDISNLENEWVDNSS